MENQTSNYYRRRFATFFVFAIFFIFLGRQLTFLPVVNLSRDSLENTMKKDISQILKGKSGFYSIYYEDLKSGKNFGIEENQIETGASINKIPIVAALYLLNKEGKINLDEQITIQKDDVQDYGTGILRYQQMPQTLSLRNLAKLALNQSDNTAAHVLGVRIGEDVVQKFVDSWGMTQTNMADNQTSVYDMSILFGKIYKGEVANKANTKELLNFMTETENEKRLPNDLPSGVNVYHKAGDGAGFVHDVGIIQSDAHIYFLGIMTSDVSGKENETAGVISQISKKVYDDLTD